MSTEKSVEELLELIQKAVRKVKDGNMTFHQFNDAMKQTLQAERTKRDEMVEQVCRALEGMKLEKYEVHPKIQGLTNVGNYNQALPDAKTTIKNLLDDKK